MARWAPNARDRLEAAALDLFVENGYEETTVALIADRAGLNRATFFRHFVDKREILFGGETRLAGLFAAGARDAPPDATLSTCLAEAVGRAGTLMTAEEHRKAAQRRAVAASNTQVQERGLLKQRAVADALTAALKGRGVDELTARLGAEVALLAFSIALQRWVASDDPSRFRQYADVALVELLSRVSELTS